MENNQQNQSQPNWANMMPDYNFYDVKQFRVGFGRRLGAALIDGIIYVIILMIAIMVSGILDNIDFAKAMNNPLQFASDMEAIGPQLSILTSILALLYYSPEIFLGQTFGKMTLQIKIADKERKPASLNQLLTRFAIKHGGYLFTLLAGLTLNYFLETMESLYALVIFIGCFFVLTQNKQAFHDMGAKTAVFFKDEIISNQEIQTQN